MPPQLLLHKKNKTKSLKDIWMLPAHIGKNMLSKQHSLQNTKLVIQLKQKITAQHMQPISMLIKLLANGIRHSSKPMLKYYPEMQKQLLTSKLMVNATLICLKMPRCNMVKFTKHSLIALMVLKYLLIKILQYLDVWMKQLHWVENVEVTLKAIEIVGIMAHYITAHYHIIIKNRQI